MFAYRVRAATTRPNASFQTQYCHKNHWRTICISSPRHRHSTGALIDQSSNKPVGSLAELKERTRIADKHGQRGTQKVSKDESPLPIMDVILPDSRLLAKRLASNQIPGSRKRRSLITRFAVMAANYRNASEEWAKNAPRGKVTQGLSYLTFFTRYTFERGAPTLFRLLNPFRLYGFVVRKLGAIDNFIVQKWRNHQKREYDWRTFLKWRRRLVQNLVNWLEESPELKKLKQNDKMNYATMKLIAEKNQFAGYKLNGMVDRTNFRLRFKYANEIEEEDKILLDLSSENPALKATLKAAATRYIEMNEAISSGDTARLIQFADRRYLKELERRVALFSQTHRGAKAEWQLHKFIKPPTCLSIRAHDFFNEYRKSLVVGDRLYVNMLVKFESIQSLKVIKTEGDKRVVVKDVEKQKVTEYLVLDVRAWMKDRPPKFVMEVYEGQPLVIDNTGLFQQAEEAKKDKEKDTKEEADDGSSHPATA